METLRHLLSKYLPPRAYDLLVRTKYLHFFLTGITGVLINLVATWFLTTFVFGLEYYFSAYIIGVAVNLVFNFVLHTIVTFKARTHVFQRMLGFVAYSFSMTLFQAWVVKTVTPIVGLEWYLFVIAGVIMAFSVVTFVLFKLFLFKEHTEERKYFPQLLVIAMFSSAVLHVTGLLETLSISGIFPLIAGDATGYIELAKNLLSGYGFVSVGGDGILSPELFRTPGLPLLLVPFVGFPWGIQVYLFLQTFFSATLLPFLTYHVGRKLFSPRAGMIAAWLIALEPQVMFSSWSPLTEIPFLVVSLSAVLLMLSLREKVGCPLCKFLHYVLSGLFFGSAILIRPGAMILIFIMMLGFIIDGLVWRQRRSFGSLVALIVAFLMIFPLQVRNHSISGSYALTGSGWSNAFIDYVSAIRVVENGTQFYEERQRQKDFAAAYFQVETKDDIGSPKFSSAYRSLALEEISKHPKTVLKLESLLLVSYFTNDNYYNQLIRLGFIGKVPDRRSPSQILLQEGFSGIPRILEEMRKQYFIPLVSRLYQFCLIGLALFGLWKSPRRLSILFFIIIGLAAVTSTVIGFGVEARLRMPIMPILFLLVGHAIASGLPIPSFLRRMKPHES